MPLRPADQSRAAATVAPSEAGKGVAIEGIGVREYERAQLIERVDRESATVGASIPDRIDVGEKELALDEFVFEMRKRERIPPGERDRVEDAKRSLRRARRERRETIEEGAIDFETGEDLAREIIGIDRALNALDDLSEADLEAEAQASEAADQKRWMRFLKKALGEEEDRGRGVRGQTGGSGGGSGGGGRSP